MYPLFFPSSYPYSRMDIEATSCVYRLGLHTWGEALHCLRIYFPFNLFGMVKTSYVEIQNDPKRSKALWGYLKALGLLKNRGSFLQDADVSGCWVREDRRVKEENMNIRIFSMEFKTPNREARLRPRWRKQENKVGLHCCQIHDTAGACANTGFRWETVWTLWHAAWVKRKIRPSFSLFSIFNLLSFTVSLTGQGKWERCYWVAMMKNLKTTTMRKNWW